MRALKVLPGTAETLASISWPMRTCAISCSKICALSHIVERSAIVYSASPESALTYCPGPTLRETTVPPIGAVIVVTRLSAPVCSSLRISGSLRPRIFSRTRAASNAASAARRSFSAAASCASACCRSLEGAALPSCRPRTRLSWICAKPCCELALRFAVCAAMKSFCWTNCSGLSISSSGSPCLTRSPSLAIRRVTRPEKGVRTTVLASSLYPIWPMAAVCPRNAWLAAFAICN